MMKPADIRRRVFRRLVERDTPTKVARAIGRAVTQVSDLTAEPVRKSFGEKMAQTIERAYLPVAPYGWLTDETRELPDTEKLLQLIEELGEDGVEELRQQAAKEPQDTPDLDEWPFTRIARDKVRRLSRDELIMLETIILVTAKDFNLDIGTERKRDAA